MQTKIYHIGHLLPVWASTQLLAASRHQTLLHEIQQLSAMPAAHFKALYQPVINRYAEFTQVIPNEPQGALGGLLNLGLARAILSLRQFAHEAGGKIDADPLLNYAVFTAGLFFDVAKVISQQQIIICDDRGNYLKEWYPYLGSLVEQSAEFYKMYPYNTTAYQALNHDAAILFARQMMPQDGFVWLSSDLELFMDWLDALRGEGGEGGRKISRSLSLLRWEDILNLIKTLGQIPVEWIALENPALDDQFLLWLREGIANGSIAVNTNEAYVHLLDEGLLYLNNEVFKQFQEAAKANFDPAKLASDFNERFGLQVEMVGKIEYAPFLMKRTEKTAWVRKGMFLSGSARLIDMATTGVAASPLQNEIRAMSLQQSRELPGVKKILGAEVRQNLSSTFKAPR